MNDCQRGGLISQFILMIGYLTGCYFGFSIGFIIGFIITAGFFYWLEGRCDYEEDDCKEDQ